MREPADKAVIRPHGRRVRRRWSIFSGKGLANEAYVLHRSFALALALVGVVGGCSRYNPVPNHNLNVPVAYVLTEEARLPPGKRLTAMLLGNTTILVSDGETWLMTDGFLSRPGKMRLLFGRVEPREDIVRDALKRAGIDRVDAVLVGHSHYDHAMDAPVVVKLSNSPQRTASQLPARLVGSRSTKMVGLGGGLKEEDICQITEDALSGVREALGSRSCILPAGQDCLVPPGKPVCFGEFEVSFIKSRHGEGRRQWLSDLTSGEITEPLETPARATSYKEGGTYSIHIAHPLGNVLVHESSGFIPGHLKGYRADVVFLGIAFLGDQPNETQRDYVREFYQETVKTVAARRVVPIHWDDFTHPLNEHLVAFPNSSTDIGNAVRLLEDQIDEDEDVNLVWLPEFVRLSIFRGGAHGHRHHARDELPQVREK